MAFWGAIGEGLLGLGKGMLGGGGGGGFSAADVACIVGRVSGDAAGGVQNQRNLDNQIAQGNDRNNLTRTGLDINQRQGRDSHALERAALLERMGMDRAKLGIEAPMARTRQAAYGDALKNIQDVNIDFQSQTGPMSKFNVTGGIRPSMFGENARAAGGELGRQALMALMTKSDVPAMTDVPEASALVDLPEMTAPKGSGALEKTLGGVGLGGSILGGIGEFFKKSQQPPILQSRRAAVPITSAPMV